MSLRGEVIWDPFGGSGTTALEAILLGRQAISTDANPLSEIIGRAKTLTLTKEEEDNVKGFIAELAILSRSTRAVQNALDRDLTDLTRYIPPIPNIDEWFHPHAIS